ncbi:MAG: hypothetical protein HY741_25985 [Chloroflexi bacterium]|nr:hypothetical protein [Chloroflexota bacterium]
MQTVKRFAVLVLVVGLMFVVAPRNALAAVGDGVPILYYDFENNTTRTTFENLVEQAINSGSDALTRTGASITYVAGAGTFNGGAADGQAITGSSWDTATADPGTATTDYYQFVVNTTGFSQLSISFDNQASATGPARVGILYSTDGSTFTATTTSLTGNGVFTSSTFDLTAISAIDNQSSVTIRIYAYAGDATDRTGRSTFSYSGTFRIDNLTVTAKTMTASQTLLNYPNIGLSIKSGTAYTPTYTNFIVNSPATATLASELILSGASSAVAVGATMTTGTYALTNNGTLTVNGTLATGAGITNNGTLAVNGTLQINNGGVISGTAPTYASTSTLKYTCACTYGRSTEWSATSGAGYPANVQISNSTTLNYPNGSTAARSISGNLTIDSGSALYMDYGNPIPGVSNPLTVAGNLVLNGSMSLGNASGGDLYLGGNWSNSGSFDPNSRAVFFNGSSAQALTGATIFDYLTLDNSSGLTLNNNATVNQTLALTSGDINTGANTLTHSGTCSGSGDVVGNVARSDIGATTRCFGNQFNTVTVSSGSVPNLTVNLAKNTPSGFTNAIKRTYSFSPDSSSLSATVRLHYLDADLNGNTDTGLNVWHKESGTWTNLERTGNVDTTNKWVEKSGVTSFSPFTLSSNSTPTSAGLISFKAKLTPKHLVKVKWETGTETTLLGFNVYRQTVGAKKWVKVNANLIAAKNPGGISGAKYSFTDKTAKSGKSYRYKLQVVGSGGGSEWSDVIKIAVP